MSDKFIKIFASFILAVFFSTSLSHALDKDAFFYTLEGEILGGYSEVSGRDGETSLMSKWLVSPNLKLSDELFWINLYNGNYNRSAQVIAQEEGGRNSSTTQTHNLSTSFKYFMNEQWSLRPIFFANWIFVNETDDEDFGEGLYDYEELGGGLESAWTTYESDRREDTLKLGFRYIDRQYPNYQSLISLVGGTIERNEKDLDGYKINLGHESRSKDAWSWGLEAIFFYKDYTDKKTVNSNGILDPSETREDFVEVINAHVGHGLWKDWYFRLGGQFSANQSNLDFYDTHNTAALTDDDFIAGYFDYYSFEVKPSLTYSQKWAEKRTFVLTLEYSFDALLYPDRRIQNAAGRYESEEQEDFTHTFSARTQVPVTENIDWVSYGSYTTADSNQDFERFYLYSYDLWSVLSGVSVKF